MLNGFRLKMIYINVLLLEIFLAPLSGICDSTDGHYTVYGPGNDSCGKFLEARRNKNDAIYATWAAGYVTAINHASPATYDILGKSDSHGAVVWLENYCHQNPLKKFASAVETLVDELYPRRTTQAPE